MGFEAGFETGVQSRESNAQPPRKVRLPGREATDRSPVMKPLSKPVGFVSDIHGNMAALAAVQTYLREQGVTALAVAGDLLLGGPQPLEVWRTLQDVNALCIRGVSDDALTQVDLSNLAATSPDERAKLEAFESTRRAVGELVLTRVRRLPDRLRLPFIDGSEVLMVHGSPASPYTEMTADMTDEELAALLNDDPADIVICGASHVPFSRQVEDTRIVNVGSVGDAPEGPYAHVTIVTPQASSVAIHQAQVNYANGPDLDSCA